MCFPLQHERLPNLVNDLSSNDGEENNGQKVL